MAESVFLRNLDHIRVKDPKIYEALIDIQNALRPVNQPAPPQVSGIAVTAANGWFTIALTDTGDVNAGVEYFIEYSTTAAFQQPIVVHNGASRTAVLNLGNQTLFWRAYSQYQNPLSPPSKPIVFGNPPTGVVGGGAAVPPAVASTGSGTASTNGQQGGSGFGKQPIRQGQRLELD
jgi:hypothetical protein